jgi:hypothetical protein
MLSPRFLTGADAVRYDDWPGVPDRLPGIFVARASVRAGGLRFLGTFQDLETSKTRILAFGAGGPKGRAPVGAAGSWHIHHVVERQDFAHVDFSGALVSDPDGTYRRFLPCVLLDELEHVKAYNTLLHSGAMAELHRPGAPGSSARRAQEAKAAAADRARRQELLERVARLERAYRQAYAGEPVLARIAQNLFAAQRALLR